MVTVVGPAGGITALADQLPDTWEVRIASPGEVVETDLLVIAAATGSRIAAAVRLHRGIPVIGIVDAFAPAEQVVEVLEAGADACVRSGQPALVGSHLRACYRRRALGKRFVGFSGFRRGSERRWLNNLLRASDPAAPNQTLGR